MIMKIQLENAGFALQTATHALITIKYVKYAILDMEKKLLMAFWLEDAKNALQIADIVLKILKFAQSAANIMDLFLMKMDEVLANVVTALHIVQIATQIHRFVRNVYLNMG